MEQPELFTKFYTVMITNHLTSQLQYSFVLTHAGSSFIPSLPNVVPISPITFEWAVETQKLSRQQLPLLLRYAITIHKCQGQTLKKAVVDIGKSELSAGCTFVAISRLPRLDCGLIQPMPFERLKAISPGRNFARRKEEEI